MRANASAGRSLGDADGAACWLPRAGCGGHCLQLSTCPWRTNFTSARGCPVHCQAIKDRQRSCPPPADSILRASTILPDGEWRLRSTKRARPFWLCARLRPILSSALGSSFSSGGARGNPAPGGQRCLVPSCRRVQANALVCLVRDLLPGCFMVLRKIQTYYGYSRVVDAYVQKHAIVFIVVCVSNRQQFIAWFFDGSPPRQRAGRDASRMASTANVEGHGHCAPVATTCAPPTHVPTSPRGASGQRAWTKGVWRG